MQEKAQDTYLLVGIGNPGSAYQETRHNIGFQIATAFAEKQQLSFRKEAALHGELAKGMLLGRSEKVIVLKPLTYVNRSGEAVQACMRYFRIRLERLLVISDEFAMPFGKLRVSERGSAGGHNGLKSIEQHLMTQHYSRLRFGIGDREQGDLADHVLSKFAEEERSSLPSLIEQAAQVLYTWITQGSEPAKRACAPLESKKSEQGEKKNGDDKTTSL